MESTTTGPEARPGADGAEVGRRSLGAVALRNELTKMTRRPATLVTVGFTLLVVGLQFGESWWSSRGTAEQSFALPGAWPEIVTGPAQVGLIFGSVLVILLVASEFSWRTARQNVIDGLSKEAWYRGKAYLVVVLALLFLVLQVGTGLAFAAAGTDGLTLGALLPEANHVSAMGGYVLAFLGYGGLALAVATSVRGTGASVGVWFLYVALGERLLRTGLGALGGTAADVARYLPVQALNSLVSYLQHDPAALGRAASRAAAEGNPPPQVWEWNVLLPVTVAWAALFFSVAFLVHWRRDL